MTDKPVTTRFAPSPTGQLHVGGARTALFAWAFARQQSGQFVIRMEDTDQARSSVASTKSILRDLQWLNLDWDQGPDANADDPTDIATQIGENGPYFQSQRLDIYNEHIEKLLASGAAYRPDDEPEIVRMKMGRDISFKDEVYGSINVPAADLEDFVIQKSDGFPTYHFAVVVDDALMGVTHVIRGQEHLNNTPKHVALQEALGFDRPVYVHMPSIMNPDGSKMSKRDKAKAARQAAKQAGIAFGDLNSPNCSADDFQAFLDKKNGNIEIAEDIAANLGIVLPEIDVSDFRRAGYTPAVLINYLSLLGWNPGDNVERFDVDFLVEKFGFQRMGKSNAKFDRQKLIAFSGDTLAAMNVSDFESQLKLHWQDNYPDQLAGLGEHLSVFCAAYQPRAKTLSDPAQQGAFIWLKSDDIEYVEKAVKKNLLKNDGEGLAALKLLREKLEGLDPWSGEAAHDLIGKLAEETGDNMGKFAQPLRVALTGNAVSPPIDQTLNLLGREETHARIDRCLKTYEANLPA